MQYQVLTDAQRLDAVNQRIGALEAEHFAHEMNRQALLALPESDERDSALQVAVASQTTIEEAHGAALTLRDELSA